MLLPIDDPPGHAVRPHHARAHAHLRVRHHPAVADPPQRAAVGERRVVGLRARPLEPDRSDAGPRRRGRRHRAEDDRARRLRQHEQPAPDLQPRPRGVRVHRGQVRQGRHPPVPLLAAQERHRRRRGRLRRSAEDEEGRVRPGLRALSEGPLQAVPRQGAAGRLRPRPGAEQGEDELRRSVLDRAVALGRSDRGRHGQPQGPRARHRPALGEGRIGRAQPDGRLRQGHRLRSRRAARRAVEHDAVAVVVAEGRSPRVLRPHREGADAHHPERPDPQDRRADSDEVGRRARVAVLLAGRQDDRVRGAARRASATSTRWTSPRKRSSTSRPTTSPISGRPTRRRQVHHLQRAGQREPEAVPPRSRHEEEDAAHLRHARRNRRAVHRRPHARLLVDGDRPDRAARARRWPRTATSTTSGRST